MEEDDHDDDNSLFEENGLDMDLEADTPPHLRDLASAVQLGDLNALRLALGFPSPFLLLQLYSFILHFFTEFCFFFLFCKTLGFYPFLKRKKITFYSSDLC